MTQAVPDGWYPDPSDPRRGRYWRDGAWTDAVATPDGRTATEPLQRASAPAEPTPAPAAPTGRTGLLARTAALDEAVLGDRARRRPRRPTSTADKVGWAIIGALGLVVGVSLLSSDDLPRREISSGEYGPGWTLSVESALLVCDDENRYGEGLRAVFLETDGRRYAVNGTARGGAYPPVEDLFTTAQPRDPSPSLDVNDLVGMGVQVCAEAA